MPHITYVSSYKQQKSSAGGMNWQGSGTKTARVSCRTRREPFTNISDFYPTFEHCFWKKDRPKNLMSRKEVLDSGSGHAQLCT